MKVAVVGAGMTGAYLYRRLSRRGMKVHLFGKQPKTRCGIGPCAWGTSQGFAGFVRACGLEPEEYILRRLDHVWMEGLRIPAELMTFDKPRLIRDLLKGEEVRAGVPSPESYGRIIDATGATRALLPAIEKDRMLPCVQWRIRSAAPLKNRIKLGKVGYAWCFPLHEGEYHVGCGSLVADPLQIVAELGWAKNAGEVLCACKGPIRISGPSISLPFVNGVVWGLGEAIGCVAPLAGDGIIPGLRSAEILLACWEDPQGYTQAILREFQWMAREGEVIAKLTSGASLGLQDAWVLKKNSRRMGMQITLKNAALLLSRLR